MSKFLRLRTQHSALSTPHPTAKWDSEQSAEFDVALSVFPRHPILRRPGRAQDMSDLIMLQRVAERGVPPWRGAGRSNKWREVAVFGVFSSICSLVQTAWGIATSRSVARCLLFPRSSFISASSKSGLMTPDMLQFP
jgi:hypothetical protein